MADAAVVTDKSLQLKVLGAIAILSIVMVGIVSYFLETSTISTAVIVLLAGVLVSIVALALEL